MPSRRITAAGRTWNVYPSGFVTPNEHDEFGLIYIAGEGADRELRVTRYSPVGTRSREQSLAELTDAQLVELLAQSQPSFTSPEAGYAAAPRGRAR
ncbi:MAG TPA: hypothetical protein VKA84_16270 [Gemmatimonadaceae bacterium]|nr:hypothetical protein [Gemmatimonadaceae bacterium]